MELQIKDFEDYDKTYRYSVEKPEEFWAGIADTFFWKKKWTNVLNWNFKEPNIKWFENGKLNITENCLDRHIYKNGDKPAIIWEPNDPTESARILSYKQLLDRKSTRLNSSHVRISYAVFCLKKKKKNIKHTIYT